VLDVDAEVEAAADRDKGPTMLVGHAEADIRRVGFNFGLPGGPVAKANEIGARAETLPEDTAKGGAARDEPLPVHSGPESTRARQLIGRQKMRRGGAVVAAGIEIHLPYGDAALVGHTLNPRG